MHFLFKLTLTTLLVAFFCKHAVSQDSLSFQQAIATDSSSNDVFLKFSYKQLIIPAVFITYGALSFGDNAIAELDLRIHDRFLQRDKSQFTLDDVTQYLPVATVYGLNLVGVKGKNNFRDRTVIMACSYLTMAVVVNGLKHIIDMERPDGSANNSFPSGHTATAFVGAEFLWQEYKDVSIWYGIAGYTVAAGTGYLRMYNIRHWLSDVLAGAGIGILSTKFSYWIYPSVQRWLFKDKRKKYHTEGAFLPYYNGQQVGLSLVLVR